MKFSDHALQNSELYLEDLYSVIAASVQSSAANTFVKKSIREDWPRSIWWYIHRTREDPADPLRSSRWIWSRNRLRNLLIYDVIALKESSHPNIVNFVGRYPVRRELKVIK
jgi:hypothetical protein